MRSGRIMAKDHSPAASLKEDVPNKEVFVIDAPQHGPDTEKTAAENEPNPPGRTPYQIVAACCCTRTSPESVLPENHLTLPPAGSPTRKRQQAARSPKPLANTGKS